MQSCGSYYKLPEHVLLWLFGNSRCQALIDESHNATVRIPMKQASASDPRTRPQP